MQLPVTFNFRLILKGPGVVPKVDVAFRSISGLAGFVDNNTSEIKNAAAANAHVITYDTLVLRRAVVHIDNSPLTEWVFSWLYKDPGAAPLDEATIELLDEKQQPYMSWKVTNVTPRAWKLDELNAEKNEVLFETIELAYTSLTFVSNKPPKPPKGSATGTSGSVGSAGNS